MIEPRFIPLEWFHMLVPLSTRPQHHMSIRDENQLSKSCIKLHYHKFLARLPQTTWRSISKYAGAQLHIFCPSQIKLLDST